MMEVDTIDRATGRTTLKHYTQHEDETEEVFIEERRFVFMAMISSFFSG